MNTFALKMRGERFFCEYKNGRVYTAWHLAGAELFISENEPHYEKIAEILTAKKIQYQKVGIIIDPTTIPALVIPAVGKAQQSPQEGEIEIINFNMKLLDKANMALIETICRCGYNETGNKFSVCYNGSKGYLDNVEISCEGYQKANNRIKLERNKDNSVKSKQIWVFYSSENGIRISQI